MLTFLQNILNNEQINLDPLNFIGVLIAALVPLYIFKADTPFSYLQERHEKLIFPLFDLLEPMLYKKMTDSSIWNKIFILIEQNKSIADGKLLQIYYYCKKNPSDENFIDLCSYIDRAYDKSCRSLKLKRRSIEYRINRKQYKSKGYFTFYLLMHTFVFMFFLVLGILMLAITIFLMGEIFKSARNTEKIALLLIYSTTAFAVLKFFEKRF